MRSRFFYNGLIRIAAPSLILGFFLTLCSAAPSRAAVPPKIENSGSDAEQPPPTLNELLDQISAAYRHKNYALGLSLVKKAIELKQNDVSSMDKIGSVYYALGRYGEALTVWTQALPLERDKNKRRELENSIFVARQSLGLSDENSVATATPPPAARKSPPSKPKNKIDLSAEKKASIQAFYKKGVKYYASGQYLQATTAFLRILDMDPGNADATKALQRLKLEQ